MKIALFSILLVVGASQISMAQSSSLLELRGEAEFKKQSPQVFTPSFSESAVLSNSLLKNQPAYGPDNLASAQAPEKVYSSMPVHQPQGKQSIPAAQPDPAITYQLLVKEVEVVPPAK